MTLDCGSLAHADRGGAPAVFLEHGLVGTMRLASAPQYHHEQSGAFGQGARKAARLDEPARTPSTWEGQADPVNRDCRSNGRAGRLAARDTPVLLAADRPRGGRSLRRGRAGAPQRLWSSGRRERAGVPAFANPGARSWSGCRLPLGPVRPWRPGGYPGECFVTGLRRSPSPLKVSREAPIRWLTRSVATIGIAVGPRLVSSLGAMLEARLPRTAEAA